MAEKGAYLTGTTFTKPSLFEVVAHESLASILEPAFKRVLSFIASCNPERYGSLLNWSDEGYVIFNALLQRYYFDKYSASFSEKFYGLRRISLLGTSGSNQSLSRKQKALSLILIILAPYLKTKFTNFAQATRTDAKHYTWRKFLTVCIARGYLLISTIYEFVVLYNFVLYVSGRSVCPTLTLKLLSVTLTYAEPQSIVSASELLQKIRGNSFGIADGWELLQRLIARSLEFGAFFLRFVYWWSQENSITNLIVLPTPSPPKISNIAIRFKGTCPICHKPQRVHAALSVSGYVFCYQCILPIIRETKKCPVTNYPANEDDLIRLYVQ